jgi:hypothetical protein
VKQKRQSEKNNQEHFNFTMLPNDLVDSIFLNSSEKMLLTCLRRFNPCYPSQIRIAAMMGCSVRKVGYLLRGLREKGWVDWKPMWLNGKKVSLYSVNLVIRTRERKTLRIVGDNADKSAKFTDLNRQNLPTNKTKRNKTNEERAAERKDRELALLGAAPSLPEPEQPEEENPPVIPITEFKTCKSAALKFLHPRQREHFLKNQSQEKTEPFADILQFNFQKLMPNFQTEKELIP